LLFHRRANVDGRRRLSSARCGSLLVAIALGAASLGCGSESEPSAPKGWHEAFDASETGWLLSTWGASADDVYAVGGSEAEGLARHWDGKQWAPLELGVGVPLLNWVHGFSHDDVTLVGNAGTVLHWSGGAWSVEPTPTSQNLWGVWGAAPDDLWAVGGSGNKDGDATLLHFDGSAWQSVALPTLQKAGVNAFFKVWGTSASDVYVVGQKGAVLHFDGASWQEQLVGASDDLIALWGTGPLDVVAVGGRAIGIVSVYDGSGWKTQSLAPLPGLNGVWSRKPGSVHVVGVAGTLAVLDTKDYSLLDSSIDTSLDVHGVFGGAGGRLFAVGGNFAGPVPPYRGIALTRELANDE
jgi:hypothetical protein